MEKLVIIGISETAERILTFCELYNLYEVIGFAVDSQYRRVESYHDRPVWDLETLDKQIDKSKVLVFVALFWNHLNGDRRRLFDRLNARGYHFANILSPMSSIRGEIGQNCWVMDFAVVQEGARIGDNVIMADNAFVGNMTEISDHCFIGAKATIMGASKVGLQCFIGIGACIYESVVIGSKCIIGACTIVKKDIPCFTMVKVESSNVIKTYDEKDIENKMVARYKVKQYAKKIE